jgi:hypothetical protein
VKYRGNVSHFERMAAYIQVQRVHINLYTLVVQKGVSSLQMKISGLTSVKFTSQKLILFKDVILLIMQDTIV